VNERLPDNLATLYSGFSRELIDSIYPGETFVVDGVEFVCKYAPESTADRFYIVKSLPFVEYFVDFCKEFEGGRIFELGIAEGGSTALLALVAKPSKLVAVDLEPERLDALDEFSARRRLTEVVRPFYGVDQADAGRLRQIVADEFGGSPLDLVLDDASHQLGPTRTSFEVLFPYLRADGLYTIEDWHADQTFRHGLGAALRDSASRGDEAILSEFRRSMSDPHTERSDVHRPSLTRLAVELLLAAALSPGVVAEVTFNEHWIIVRRGPAAVDPVEFRLESLYRDYFGFLPAPGDAAP
jgi:predicted O-methyltransferase YrrM